MGDADRMLTILSDEQGLIRASAKGVRRLKNKLTGASQLFCYGEFSLFLGRDYFIINNCEIIEPFSELFNDPEKFTYAAHIIKIVNDVCQDGLPSADTLSLLLNTLFVINKGEKNPMLAIRIFELRLLCISGYMPSVEKCGVCSLEGVRFSANANGLVCENCSKLLYDSIEISNGTKSALSHVCTCEKSKLFSFDVSNDVLIELNEILPAYILKCFEKKYNTLDFLDLIK